MVLFVSSLMRKLFVAVKSKQLKTIDARTLLPHLMYYYEDMDKLEKMVCASRFKD